MTIEKDFSEYKAFKQAMDIVREYDKDDCAYIANLILTYKDRLSAPESISGEVISYYKPLSQGEIK